MWMQLWYDMDFGWVVDVWCMVHFLEKIFFHMYLWLVFSEAEWSLYSSEAVSAGRRKDQG